MQLQKRYTMVYIWTPECTWIFFGLFIWFLADLIPGRFTFYFGWKSATTKWSRIKCYSSCAAGGTRRFCSLVISSWTSTMKVSHILLWFNYSQWGLPANITGRPHLRGKMWEAWWLCLRWILHTSLDAGNAWDLNGWRCVAGLIPRDLATQKVAKWQVHSSAAYKGQQRNTQNVDGFQVFQRPSINSPQIDMVDMCCFKRVCCFSASLFLLFVLFQPVRSSFQIWARSDVDSFTVIWFPLVSIEGSMVLCSWCFVISFVHLCFNYSGCYATIVVIHVEAIYDNK